MSSARYEDLHDDLHTLKQKIRAKVQTNISKLSLLTYETNHGFHYFYSLGEGTLNGLLSEGDNTVLLMRKEVDIAPRPVKDEMQSRWSIVNGEWASFKRQVRTGGLRSSTASPFSNPSVNPTLVRGTSIMERTGASIQRATMVAQESEAIGTEVVNELGVQREALVRTRERLTDTNQDLKTTSVILRTMNRRVLTNKCLLIVVVIIEMAIFVGLVYWKFFSKKRK